MNVPEFRIMSLGALAAHPLWEEKGDVRTGHATTVLVTLGDTHIIVNPSLPSEILQARMSERTRVRPDEITHVFLTTFAADHYRGLPLFEEARWLLHEVEHQAASAALDQQLAAAHEHLGRDAERLVLGHRALLERFRDAEDRIAPGVDLFPLPGLTPGTCGLLLARPAQTILICGDAVPTFEHLEEGKVLSHCADIEQAKESFREAIEIADVLILGRDNAASNPMRRAM